MEKIQSVEDEQILQQDLDMLKDNNKNVMLLNAKLCKLDEGRR